MFCADHALQWGPGGVSFSLSWICRDPTYVPSRPCSSAPQKPSFYRRLAEDWPKAPCRAMSTLDGKGRPVGALGSIRPAHPAAVTVPCPPSPRSALASQALWRRGNHTRDHEKGGVAGLGPAPVSCLQHTSPSVPGPGRRWGDVRAPLQPGSPCPTRAWASPVHSSSDLGGPGGV